MKNIDDLNYTLVDPNNDENKRIEFIKDDTSPFYSGQHLPRKIIVDGNEIATIDPQQMFELGVLLISFAGDNFDYDSAIELLEGYGIDIPSFLDRPCSSVDDLN